jgi:hypothetical protein
MAKTDELLYLETEGACAYCGHRDRRALTIHHLAQSNPKNEDYDNKLVLCHNCHQCHHEGKGATAKELLEIKRQLILKTLTRSGLNAMKEANRRTQVVAMPFLVNHLVEYGYLTQGEMIRGEWSSDDNTMPKYIVDAEYTITLQGKALLKKWKFK